VRAKLLGQTAQPQVDATRTQHQTGAVAAALVQVAQSVEQWTENPRVASSILALDTVDAGQTPVNTWPRLTRLQALAGVTAHAGEHLAAADAPAGSGRGHSARRQTDMYRISTRRISPIAQRAETLEMSTRGNFRPAQPN
jgi:hypothetical protein